MLGGVEGSGYLVQIRPEEDGSESIRDDAELGGGEYFSKSEVTQSVDDPKLHHNNSKPLQISCISHIDVYVSSTLL